MPQLRISNAEYMRRRETLFGRLADRNVEALVLFGPNNVSYLTAFGFIPTERPMAAVVTPQRAAPGVDVKASGGYGCVHQCGRRVSAEDGSIA